jgi:hypothetical protein
MSKQVAVEQVAAETVDKVLDSMESKVDSDLDAFLKLEETKTTKDDVVEDIKPDDVVVDENKDTDVNPDDVIVDDDKDEEEKKVDIQPGTVTTPTVAELLTAQPPGGQHASSATQANWKVMQTALKEAQSAKESFEAEVKTLKDQIGQAPKEIQEELEYLRNRVAEFDVASLPEFKQKYDAVVDQSKTSVVDFLGKLAEAGRPGLGKEFKADLEKALGDTGYLEYPWQTLLDKLEEVKAVSGSERKAIETQIGQAILASQGKEVAIKEQASKVKQTQEQRVKEFNSKVEGLKTTLANGVAEYKAKYPWLNAPTLPTNATPEQKADFEKTKQEHETLDKTFRKLINGYLANEGVVTNDYHTLGKLEAKELMDIAVESFRAKRIEGDLKAKDAEIARLQKEVNTFKKAGNTSASASAHRPTNAKQSTGPVKITSTQLGSTTLDNDLQDFLSKK